MSKKIKVIDLFSGIGGLSLGFQNAGFEIIAAYDNWDAAIDVYQQNFSHPIYKRDISDDSFLNEIKKLDIDMIIGGPPCQDFSIAGHRNENLGRSDLTLSFAKIIEKIRPKWFLMENVPRIEKSNILKLAKEKFINSNYGLTQIVLDANKCGVPQARKRFFLIGELNGKDNTLFNELINSQNSEQMSLYDYFGESLDFEYYFRVPRSYSRRGIFSIYEPSPTIRGVDRPLPKGYPGHPSDAIELNNSIRSLTIHERGLIQTFPENFKYLGTKTNLNQMIGNAVPVKLAEHIGLIIKKYIR